MYFRLNNYITEDGRCLYSIYNDISCVHKDVDNATACNYFIANARDYDVVEYSGIFGHKNYTGSEIKYFAKSAIEDMKDKNKICPRGLNG
jgi:hypothetical protein